VLSAVGLWKFTSKLGQSWWAVIGLPAAERPSL